MSKIFMCVPPAQGLAGAQRGQSVVEALLVLTVLGSLGVAIAWLGRLQDIDLQLLHVSRRVAFARAHQGLEPLGLAAGVDGYFGGFGQAWHRRQGGDLLAVAGKGMQAPLDIRVLNSGLRPQVQVGDPVREAAQWRAQLHLGEAGVWRAEVSVQTRPGNALEGVLRDFDGLGLRLNRHTAILWGSGVADSDEDAQALLSESSQAWGQLAENSQRRGRIVQQRLEGIDEVWGRSPPGWDWTLDWVGRVPPRYLQTWRQP